VMHHEDGVKLRRPDGCVKRVLIQIDFIFDFKGDNDSFPPLRYPYFCVEIIFDFSGRWGNDSLLRLHYPRLCIEKRYDLAKRGC